ncbi:MAG: hypothetical protein EXR58_08170 [Chloroflexi bacterium]|nr:hypothetical protein [Chloroflexota bacterium]
MPTDARGRAAWARHLGLPRVATRRLQDLVLVLFANLQVVGVVSGWFGDLDGRGLLLIIFYGAVGLVGVELMLRAHPKRRRLRTDLMPQSRRGVAIRPSGRTRLAVTTRLVSGQPT